MVLIRVSEQVVVRDSDGRALLLIAAYCGPVDRPVLLEVVQAPDDDEPA